MIFRRLSPADFDSYRKLRLRALKDEPNAFAIDYAEELASGSEFMRDRLDRAFSVTAVFGAFDPATETQALVAMVGLFRDDRKKTQHRAGIWGVYTLPSHRGRSLSQQLLSIAVDHARAVWHSRVILLSVESTNDSAKALYQKLGFRSWGVEPKALLVDDRFYAEEHMILE
jgi:ribosomal protein S18 acetylase RimI-like enzyme